MPLMFAPENRKLKRLYVFKMLICSYFFSFHENDKLVRTKKRIVNSDILIIQIALKIMIQFMRHTKIS